MARAQQRAPSPYRKKKKIKVVSQKRHRDIQQEEKDELNSMTIKMLKEEIKDIRDNLKLRDIPFVKDKSTLSGDKKSLIKKVIYLRGQRRKAPVKKVVVKRINVKSKPKTYREVKVKKPRAKKVSTQHTQKRKSGKVIKKKTPPKPKRSYRKKQKKSSPRKRKTQTAVETPPCDYRTNKDDCIAHYKYAPDRVKDHICVWVDSKTKKNGANVWKCYDKKYNKCNAVTNKGTRCKRYQLENSLFCKLHKKEGAKSPTKKKSPKKKTSPKRKSPTKKKTSPSTLPVKKRYSNYKSPKKTSPKKKSSPKKSPTKPRRSTRKRKAPSGNKMKYMNSVSPETFNKKLDSALSNPKYRNVPVNMIIEFIQDEGKIPDILVKRWNSFNKSVSSPKKKTTKKRSSPKKRTTRKKSPPKKKTSPKKRSPKRKLSPEDPLKYLPKPKKTTQVRRAITSYGDDKTFAYMDRTSGDVYFSTLEKARKNPKYRNVPGALITKYIQDEGHVPNWLVEYWDNNPKL